jgi:DNA polymerase-3 subunit chi
MRVDFSQLGPGMGPEGIVAALAGKLLGEGERLLVVSSDEQMLARLDRQLWDHSATSFLPHGLAGGPDDPRQPVLLATGTEAPNGARNLLIADGDWREAALAFDRAFYLFDQDSVDAARTAWKALKGREGLERHYWANEDGRWTEKG